MRSLLHLEPLSLGSGPQFLMTVWSKMRFLTLLLKFFKATLVTHTCNPALTSLIQEGHQEFEANLGYRVNPCLQTKDWQQELNECYLFVSSSSKAVLSTTPETREQVYSVFSSLGWDSKSACVSFILHAAQAHFKTQQKAISPVLFTIIWNWVLESICGLASNTEEFMLGTWQLQ